MKLKLIIVLFFTSIIVSAQNKNDNYFKGIAAFKYQEYEKAINYFSEAIKNNPKDYSLYQARGNVYYEQEQFKNAINNYKKAEEIQSETALLQLSKSYSQLSMPDSAVFFLEKYLEKYDKETKAIIKLNQAFKPIQNSKQWKSLWRQEWYSKPEQQIGRVYYLIEQERYIEAINDLNLMLLKNRKNHKVYAIKAKIYFITENFKNARKNYSKAIKYRNYETEYYICRARAYYKLGRNRKAIEDYNFAIEKSPRTIELYHERALCYNKIKKYEFALEDISFYVKYFYNDEQAIYDCGIINYNSGDYLSSIKYFNQLIEENPAEPKYYVARANSYLETSTYNYAIDDYSQALDIDPNLTTVYYNRGFAQLQNGDKQAACADWQMSIKNKDYRANNYIIKYCE